MTMRWMLCGAAAGALLALAPPVGAVELRIGLSSEPSSIDPHFHNLGPNNQIRRHIFESLTDTDETQLVQPGLAESWEAVDDTTWVFNLRQGVKFHDGSEFTAQDVIYTMCRIPTVEGSPSSFTIYTRFADRVTAPDPYTLVIETAQPYPMVPVEVSTWGILSSKALGGEDVVFHRDGCEGADWPRTEDFNNGRWTIGTGPYRFEEFAQGDRLVLTRNDDYWGEHPEWERVTFRPMTSAGPRVAGLLAGDVDLIESPPVQDLQRLRDDPNTDVVQALSNRVIYLLPDSYAEPTPGVTGTDGGNPFKDARVREAVSIAINREAITQRLMEGLAEPANQLLPDGFFGNNPNIPPIPYDPDRAMELLAEAGYPEGFGLVLGTPNDRYMNDEAVSQAIAQMLTRIGIETEVDASTASVFFSRRNQYEFSLYLAGWGAATGEMSSPLRALVATPNPDKGMGGTNLGRHSNPEMDALLEQALVTIDDAEREKLLQEAVALVIADHGIVPLHYEVTPWAFRTGLTYEGRADQYTLAMGVRSVTN
jgi:peptide/nickel transport system substrate-binding protein